MPSKPMMHVALECFLDWVCLQWGEQQWHDYSVREYVDRCICPLRISELLTVEVERATADAGINQDSLPRSRQQNNRTRRLKTHT